MQLLFAVIRTYPLLMTSHDSDYDCGDNRSDLSPELRRNIHKPLYMRHKCVRTTGRVAQFDPAHLKPDPSRRAGSLHAVRPILSSQIRLRPPFLAAVETMLGVLYLFTRI
jgi:hypothetical protein